MSGTNQTDDDRNLTGHDVTEAFDRWLEDRLHVLFDPVADEPLPEALLRLIEADRRSGQS